MVMGPYTCSYILYGALAWQVMHWLEPELRVDSELVQIRRKIQRIGAAQSERTVKTQRAAYLMHLLQVVFAFSTDLFRNSTFRGLSLLQSFLCRCRYLSSVQYWKLIWAMRRSFSQRSCGLARVCRLFSSSCFQETTNIFPGICPAAICSPILLTIYLAYKNSLNETRNLKVFDFSCSHILCNM